MQHLCGSHDSVRLIGRSLTISFALATLYAASGCGKEERVPTTAERLAYVQQIQQTQPDFYVPRKTVDYMADLKSIKDAPGRLDVAAAKSTPAKVPDVKSVVVETAKPAAPIVAPGTTSAQVPAPSASAPPANIVASQAPTARQQPRADVQNAIAVISREQPEFPREALRAGVENGTVRARLTISASGEVTSVAILKAEPSRVFDRSVQQALSRWKFNDGADGRTFDTEVGFKAAN